MEEEKGLIKILSLFLLESHFKRDSTIESIVAPTTSILIDTKGGISPEGNKAFLELTIKTSKEEKIPFEAEIKMVGLFELINIPTDQHANFLKVNAPAIVFPFIREHLASLTVKAGFQPVLINTVNFVQMAKDSEEPQPKN